MSIENQRQLQNTCAKVAELEQLYVETRNRAGGNEHVRVLTLRSLKKRINQFKEEIARFTAHCGDGALASPSAESGRING